MAEHNLGKIHVYTGNNKGKTTTALGIAIRAFGHNMRVCIIQFLKGGAYTGEFITIKNFLPGLEIHQYGKPCIKERQQLSLDRFSSGNETEGFRDISHIREDIICGYCRYCFMADAEERKQVLLAYEHTKRVLSEGDFHIVILDEINNCFEKGLLGEKELHEILGSKPEKTELIFTGRGAPKELIERADLVTEMNQVKHYFEQGVNARRGIEY
ncbi:MAG TPA: cob(I)yrinic acid a,c-diamide adenosyltransferase [Candidatus Nanoarchaeia archaeon]|nr:cob(I)yrinic acid a,c-diamide adenosyltransferase [Candidatus Nanoarchaeia archaeon]